MEVGKSLADALVKQDEAEDADEKQKVDLALDAQGLFHPIRLGLRLLPAVDDGIPNEVDGKQNEDGEGPVWRKPEGPEEVHPLEEAQKEGRVAERGQAAADVGHQEGEENDGVDLFVSPLVGPK